MKSPNEIVYQKKINTNFEYHFKGKIKKYPTSNNLFISGKVYYGNLEGNVKIYNKDKIVIFQGQFENGMKNGTGIEYFSNQIKKYEGFYQNGGKTRIGKGFNTKGKLKYVFTFTKNKKLIKVIEY